MSIEAKDLRRLAHAQAAAADDEASRRSAISRAYYAAYHRCRRWEGLLPHRGRATEPGGLHDRLIQRLSAPDDRCGADIAERSRALAELLRQELDCRVAADYHLWKEVDEQTVQQQLEATRQVFATCADPCT
ncbi:hypothetical protein [Roseateles sp. MS654]|uniref:hypothetical protein n=1 Tax=Roseateles sp. MS654 TaxID=3412685 RepID=UPI003C2DBB2B